MWQLAHRRGVRAALAQEMLGSQDHSLQRHFSRLVSQKQTPRPVGQNGAQKELFSSDSPVPKVDTPHGQVGQQQGPHSYTGFQLFPLLVAKTKMTNKGKLREKGLMWALSLRLQSTVAGRCGSRSRGSWLYCVCSQGAGREKR